MIIADVVRRARRRLVWIEIAAQGGFTVCVALGAIVLLLLLGAQILDWRWLIALPAAALAAGALSILRRMPESYPTAQLVDSRLQLSDALSTALYFSTAEVADRGTEEARQAQRDQAKRLSEDLNLAKAIPFKAPRVMYPAGALALIAVSLFGLRYGLDHKLDLRPSLAHILKHAFAPDIQAAELLKQSEKDGISKKGDGRNSPGHDLQNANGNRSNDADAANSANDNSRGRAERREETEAKPERQEQADAQTNGEPQDGNGDQNAGDGSRQSEQQRSNQSAGSQSSGQAGEKAGVLSGLRDTMQNLLSTMRRQLSGGGSRQQAAMSQNSDASNPQKGNGSSQAGKGKQPGSSESEAQAGDTQNGQKGQGRGAGQSSDQQAGNQPGGGIGSQEGAKDLKLAEQAAAAGSISRINGQRSPDTNGVVTVEVQSGNQHLSTPYTQKSAGHTNAGGEINRDEVPLLYQSYVQQYFEEVRKERTPVTAKRPETKSLNR
jgi:hypothetical protein